MWLITVLIVYMLIMLTTVHAYNDDEQFRNGLVRNLVFLRTLSKLRGGFSVRQIGQLPKGEIKHIE